MVDGQTGFLVQGHDPKDYAERILEVLADRDLARRLGQGAARHAAAFSWDATAGDIRDVYQELLARPSA